LGSLKPKKTNHVFCLNIISNIFVKSYAHVWVRIIPQKNPWLGKKKLKTYWGCIQGEFLGGYLKMNPYV
jgi:hypothetical protein